MKKLLLPLFVAIPLIACNNQTTAEDTKEAQSFKSPGKPSMKVQMDYTVSKERVAVGETVDISVNFTGKQQPSHALLKTTDKMVLHGNSQLNLQKSSGGQTQHSFSVTPMTEGIHLVTVVAEDAQQSHKKPFAIRIIAGDKPIEAYLEKNGTLTTDENGEKIISMPAEER
ncbi:hypothetical protein [Kangiella taiwanensis]|uniref:Lipoprotein n=1 Tax=Kangiella taiwanensis TaxID=1079179 RepID=A0ABP8HUS9_9GAMM|nr:hypothetical protein [Kangiella taiwanensis]